MKEADKQIKEIINKFNIQPHKLTNIKYVESKEQRKDFINMLNDFINFIRCSTELCTCKGLRTWFKSNYSL